MKLKIIAISMLLMLLVTTMNLPVVVAPSTFEKFGPRVDDIIFNVAATLSNEATMLENGLIDFMDWAVPSGKIDPWLANPDLVMEDYDEAGWYEYDINVQMWPTGHGSMRPEQGADGGHEPTAAMDWTFPPSWDEGHYWIDYDGCQRCRDAKQFRKAIAHLTNRDQISDAHPGALSMMETFIFPVIAGWANPSAPTYDYSLALAKAALDLGGFKDYDGDGVREYCEHVTERNLWLPGQPAPTDTEEIPDIQLYIRSDDPPRLYAGRLLRDDLPKVGIEVDFYEGSYGAITPHAWDDYDYHIYTGGWGWGPPPTPDMYYELWHSSKDIYPSTDGDNYNRYHNEEYDALATAFKSAPDLTTAKTALDACQMMLHDDVACIALYTMAGYVAHRKNYGDFVGEQQFKDLPWEGFVNEEGYGYYGANHGFSSINAHPQGYERGGTIRHGLIDPPDKLDPVDSESFYEFCILGKIYETLIVGDPTNSTNHIPWLVSSFEDGTWDDGGVTKSNVTVELRPNILWHDNVPLTPADVNFTFWYKREAMSVADYANVKEFHHCEISGNTITIYFNITSWLALAWVTGTTIIPKHIFEAYPPTLPGDPTVPGSWSFNPETADKLIGTGPFRCNKDGVIGRIDITSGRDYIHLEANPTYHRELVRPDFAHPVPGQPVQPGPDGKVDIADFGMTIGHFGDALPWDNPTWGPITDVNKDYLVDIDDIMETGARYALTGCEEGYPPGYV